MYLYVCNSIQTGITLEKVCLSVSVVYTIKGTFVEQSSFLISTRTYTDNSYLLLFETVTGLTKFSLLLLINLYAHIDIFISI